MQKFIKLSIMGLLLTSTLAVVAIPVTVLNHGTTKLINSKDDGAGSNWYSQNTTDIVRALNPSNGPIVVYVIANATDALGKPLNNITVNCNGIHNFVKAGNSLTCFTTGNVAFHDINNNLPAMGTYSIEQQ